MITHISVGALRITRTFDFAKDSKHIDIETAIQNVSGFEVGDLISKTHAGWDVDGSDYSDTFVLAAAEAPMTR